MKFRYDYYKVLIPIDFSADKRSIAQQGICEAEANTRIYAVPALWQAHCEKIVGDDWQVAVSRKRSNIKDSRPVHFPNRD